jgi:hypothetical protein
MRYVEVMRLAVRRCDNRRAPTLQPLSRGIRVGGEIRNVRYVITAVDVQRLCGGCAARYVFSPNAVMTCNPRTTNIEGSVARNEIAA